MILTELFVILALIAVNGVFAGAEIAIVSLRKTRLQQLVDADARRRQDDRGAARRAGAVLRHGPGRHHGRDHDRGGLRWRAHGAAPRAAAAAVRRRRSADEVALAIVVVLVSFLSLVLGELVPKSLALRRGERYALLMAKPIAALSRIAKPIVWLLTASSNLVLRPFSDRTNFMEARISKEELEQMVDEAAKTRRHPRARQRARVAGAGLRSLTLERRHGAARAHRRAADARDHGSDPPLPAGGAALAHPRLRAFARRRSSATSAPRTSCRWPGTAGRSCCRTCCAA